MQPHLFVGTADLTERLLQITEGHFLLLDDGPIADAFQAHFTDAEIFNPRRHSFTVPRDYKFVRDFGDVLYSSGAGENTLTVRNGKRALTKLLLNNLTPLHKLVGNRKDPSIAEALATIDDLLLSPVLKRVLTRKPNFTFERSVIARINRAELGDFDAFVLGSLLIAQFKGHAIVPDFDFYGRPLHTNLIRQNRLTAGVRILENLQPTLRQSVLLMPNQTGSRCTHEDAVVLAAYAGLLPHHNGYNDFVERAMGL